MGTKDLDRRFGNIAMEKGFVTIDHLIKAITIQVMEEMATGVRKLIGQILYERGQITENQLEEVLKELKIAPKLFIGEIFALEPERDIHERDKHRHLHQGSDDCSKDLAGFESEHDHRDGDGQFEIVRGGRKG